MNIYKFSLFALLLFLTSCSYDEDDKLSAATDSEGIDINTVEVIRVNSDLYDTIKDIANDEDRPDESIACVDFIYPLALFIFDDNDTFVSTNYIIDDEMFSAFLGNLTLGYSISISFPIIGALESGEELTINTNEELKIAIDNCLSEEELVECNTFIQSCALKIGYSYNYENPFLGAYFQENAGFISLSLEDSVLFGSWSALIIENELFINISINEDNEVSEFFNFNWQVSYLDANTLQLTNNDRELILNKRCDDNFINCGNFIFEKCELISDEGTSEFILDDYSACIYDTLEIDTDFPISFYETEEDAQQEINAIISSEIYNNTEVTQTIYVRINNIPETDDNGEIIEGDIESYVVKIALYAINCD